MRENNYYRKNIDDYLSKIITKPIDFRKIFEKWPYICQKTKNKNYMHTYARKVRLRKSNLYPIKERFVFSRK